ncbi:MAG: hypothetical protein PHU12_03655 [Candidatus Aenigmarchaeota archaeon]|nr:hypothetical protein [Candidatus Aenigmarchaeota archaeon]
MFWNKKKSDIEQVKEAVEPSQPVLEQTRDIPEMRKIDMPSIAEPKNFAPLFIKVDKYKEVLQKIQKLKTILSSLNSLARLETELEKIAEDIENVEKKNLDEFSSIIAQLDQELVRPQSFEPYIKNQPVTDGYIKELETDINAMKSRTQNL